MVRSSNRHKKTKRTRKRRSVMADPPLGYFGESFVNKVKGALSGTPSGTPKEPIATMTPRQTPWISHDTTRSSMTRSRRDPRIRRHSRDLLPPEPKPIPKDQQLMPKPTLDEALRERFERQRQIIKSNNAPPASQPATPPLSQQWKDAAKKAGGIIKQKATEAVTPAGIVKNLKRAGSTALDYRDEINRRLIAARVQKLAAEKRAVTDRIEKWNKLSPEDRETILKTRAEQAKLKEELRQKRRSYDQYEADRLLASMSGQKFFPKVYKIPGSYNIMTGETEDKYVDEYGREVPGIPEELYKRRRARTEAQELELALGGGGISRRRSSRDIGSGEPRPRRRTEQDDIDNLFR